MEEAKPEAAAVAMFCSFAHTISARRESDGDILQRYESVPTSVHTSCRYEGTHILALIALSWCGSTRGKHKHNTIYEFSG